MEAPIGKSVYNLIEIVGTSNESWEDAVQSAIKTANQKLTNMRIAEVERMDTRLTEGEKIEYRARVILSFKHEVEPETL